MNAWVFVELGGSSAQTAQCDDVGRWWFTLGVVLVPGRPVALACPGVIRNGRVLYATHLGWPDVADPTAELAVERVPVVMNDAVAAALGESVLRTGASPTLDLIYLGLGTGVGDAYVRNGVVQDLDLGHILIGGATYCEGCRAVGWLNGHLAARYLPTPLTQADQRYVASTLARALHARAVDAQTLVVLGGGIARRHPTIVPMLADHIPNPVATTAAPVEAKSAAYAGLAYVVQQQERNWA